MYYKPRTGRDDNGLGIPTEGNGIMSGFECMECGRTGDTRTAIQHMFGCVGTRFAGYVVPIVRPVPVNIMWCL